MREVKYKAFDKVNGEWLDSDNLIFTHGCWFKDFRALEDYVALPVDEGDVVIVEFTGLKDRNGKEIYEGDIVEDELNSKYIVEYDDERCMFLLEWVDNEDKYSEFYPGMKLNVIGNIYENSDLLATTQP